MNQEPHIITLNWNSPFDTIECIESLINAGGTFKQITIVDNGSVDDSVKLFHERWNGEITTHILNKNVGFSQGFNAGILYALTLKAEWILLINNDTIVAPDFLTSIMVIAQENPKYMVFGPLILNYNDRERIWFLGERLVPGLLGTYKVANGKFDAKRNYKVEEVDFISGCAMLVNRRVFEKVGLFDPNIFMYGEDIDFCWRISQAGYQLATAPTAVMWHKVSASANRAKEHTRYLKVRNQIKFYRKYSTKFQYIAMIIYSFTVAVKNSTMDIFLKRSSLIMPLWKGWIEGWFSPFVRY